MNDASHDSAKNRRFKKRWFLIVIMVMILAAILYAWSQRIAIADRALRDQLAQYDVAVDYEIIEIGPRFQRLRNVVIGNPQNPDFSAKEVDIDVKIGWSGAVLRTIWVRGASLKGRVVDGVISFGELDNLLKSDDDEPFQLPDLALDIANSKMSIDSEWGRIGVGINGRGHLRSSFEGALAVQSNAIAYDDCVMEESYFHGQVKISNEQPRLKGKLANQSIRCAGLGAAQNIALDGALNLSQDFSRWRGDAEIKIADANNPDARLANIDGEIDFAGNFERTDIGYNLRRAALFTDILSISSISTKGEGRLSLFQDKYNIAARGTANIGGSSLSKPIVNNLQSYQNIADNSPIAPLVKIWAPALAQSAANFSGSMGYDVGFGETINGRNTILLDNVRFASRSGAGLSLSNEVMLTKSIAKSDWRIASPIGLAIRGGKLPNITANIRQGSANRWSGAINMPAYKAGDALLALRDFKFSGSPTSDWTFSGQSLISGAIPSGRVDGLSLPIDGRFSNDNGFSLLQGCQNIGFNSLEAASLRLGAQKLRLCPDGASSIVSRSKSGHLRLAAKTNDLNIKGRLGENSIAINMAAASFDLADGLNADAVRIAIGEDIPNNSENDNQTWFEMERLTANFNEDIIRGQATGGQAKIGPVPLEMDTAQLDWTFDDGILNVGGSLMVRDADQVDRFEPVLIDNLLLSLENDEISALAQIKQPNSNITLADMDLVHNLSQTKGRALFSVDNLRFNDRLQPDQLTNIVLGVVANVQGAINGDGAIMWDGETLTSRGKFSTENMDLAAAFGPVNGLSGEITLTDLLNFESADRQIVTLASVNPGVEVLNGRISYQLLPGQKVQIYGGSWPFSGGRLVLEPTIWDLAEDVEREMVFEVTGMDAAVFLSQFEFASLSATGLFNGRLPMVFDAEGGRIVGGSLVSQTGGNLAYTDALARENLSFFGNYAFDSLKSIDYDSLTVGMDGNIDGEIITGVKITGLKQGEGTTKNFITKQLSNIPIIFNVKIEASFLDLLYLIEGVGDPDATVRRYAPNLLVGNYVVVENEQPVQPRESKDSP